MRFSAAKAAFILVISLMFLLNAHIVASGRGTSLECSWWNTHALARKASKNYKTQLNVKSVRFIFSIVLISLLMKQYTFITCIWSFRRSADSICKCMLYLGKIYKTRQATNKQGEKLRLPTISIEVPISIQHGSNLSLGRMLCFIALWKNKFKLRLYCRN